MNDLFYYKQVIDGKHGTTEERLAKVKAAVDDLATKQGRRLVIVDGVGYPGVGSCVGVSNAAVAKVLQAPVLLVGRPGVGNAIDSTVMAYDYFKAHEVEIIGALWNKIPRKISYHTYEKCRTYVTKYFQQNPPSPNFSIYGHVPLLKANDGSDEDLGGACAISCALRKPSKKSLEMTEEDNFNADRISTLLNEHVDFLKLFSDISSYYERQKVGEKNE